MRCGKVEYDLAGVNLQEEMSGRIVQCQGDWEK